MSQVHIQPAAAADWEPVMTLLQAAGLPIGGVRENLGNFVVAWQAEMLVGCAGLEQYGRVGLLRSVAVRESHRGHGLGQALTLAVLAQARSSGVAEVVLLTETAPEFFPKFGFARIGRAEAPPEALVSVEFTTACSESAVVMKAIL